MSRTLWVLAGLLTSLVVAQAAPPTPATITVSEVYFWVNGVKTNATWNEASGFWVAPVGCVTKAVNIKGDYTIATAPDIAAGDRLVERLIDADGGLHDCMVGATVDRSFTFAFGYYFPSLDGGVFTSSISLRVEQKSAVDPTQWNTTKLSYVNILYLVD